MAPRDGLLGAARLALRVALRAIAIAAARRCRRTGLVLCRRFELMPPPGPYAAALFKFLKNWLPGTDSKSDRKELQFKGFLISASYRYPQKHRFQKVAATGRCRIFGGSSRTPHV